MSTVHTLPRCKTDSKWTTGKRDPSAEASGREHQSGTWEQASGAGPRLRGQKELEASATRGLSRSNSKETPDRRRLPTQADRTLCWQLPARPLESGGRAAQVQVLRGREQQGLTGPGRCTPPRNTAGSTHHTQPAYAASAQEGAASHPSLCARSGYLQASHDAHGAPR